MSAADAPCIRTEPWCLISQLLSGSKSQRRRPVGPFHAPAVFPHTFDRTHWASGRCCCRRRLHGPRLGSAASYSPKVPCCACSRGHQPRSRRLPRQCRTRDAMCSGRSCYVFHVGRVNEAKLGNFPEVIRHMHAHSITPTPSHRLERSASSLQQSTRCSGPWPQLPQSSGGARSIVQLHMSPLTLPQPV